MGMVQGDVGLILAIYGSIISTVLAIYKIIENRQNLNVSLYYAINTDRIQSEEVLAVSCVNVGKRPIILKAKSRKAEC